MQDDQSCSSAMRDDQSTIDVRVVHSKKGVIVRRGASTDTAEVARLEWGAAVRVARVSGVEPWLVRLPCPSFPESCVVLPRTSKVSVPSPPYEEHVEKRGDGFRNGRGRR